MQSKIRNELIIIIIIAIATFFLAGAFDSLETLYKFCRSHEKWELDELLISFLVTAVCLFIFAVRRIKEIDSEKQQKKLDHAKDEFLNAISLELKNPLTSLTGYSKIVHKKVKKFISQTVPDKKNEKYLKDIYDIQKGFFAISDASDHLTTLINKIIYLSELKSETKWNDTAIRIEPLIDSIISDKTSSATKKSLSITKQIKTAIPEIRGDKEKIHQLLDHLVTNAIEFTDKGTIICRVDTDLKKKRLIIQIIDTGIGISQNDQKKIFTKIVQDNHSLPDSQKRIGLGLTICKQIVDHYYGEIWVDSTVGKGSTFTVSLPFN